MDGKKIKVAEAYLKSDTKQKIYTFKVVEEITDFEMGKYTLKHKEVVTGYWIINECGEKKCFFKTLDEVIAAIKEGWSKFHLVILV